MKPKLVILTTPPHNLKCQCFQTVQRILNTMGNGQITHSIKLCYQCGETISEFKYGTLYINDRRLSSDGIEFNDHLFRNLETDVPRQTDFDIL